MSNYSLTTLPHGIRSLNFSITPDNQQLQIGDTLTISATIRLASASASGDEVRIVPGIRAAGYTNTVKSSSSGTQSPKRNFSIYGSTNTYTLRSSVYSVTLATSLQVTQAILAGTQGTSSVLVGFFVMSYIGGHSYYLTVGTSVGLTVSPEGYLLPTLTAMDYSDSASGNPYGTIGDYVQGISSPELIISSSNITKDARLGDIKYGRLRILNVGTELYNDTVAFGTASSWTKTISVGTQCAAASGTMTWELWLEDSDGVGGTTTGSYDVLPYSSPQLSFGLTRCAEILSGNDEVSYEESDDGERVWLDIDAATSSLNGFNAWTLTLTYTPNDNGGVLPITLLSDSDGSTVSYEHDPDLLTSLFSAANDYTFVATLADQFGSVSVTAYIYKSGGYFNVEKFGVRVGGRATGTAQSPKFESDYPAYMYAGIEGVNNYQTNEVLTGGHWIDGKPLYRKIIHMTSASTVDISDLDFDFIRMESALSYTIGSGSTVYRCTPYYLSSASRATVYINGTNLIITLGSDLHLRDAWIILEYTKNTTTTT